MDQIALSLVEPIVSPIVDRLKNAALAYFGGDITEKELRHLQNIIIPKIKAGLLVAEAKNVAELQPYLVTLKEAAYEAEDMLDMYEYRRLKDQVSSAPKFIKTLKKTARAVFAPFSLKTELKNTMENLITIADGIDKFSSIISNFPNQDPLKRQQQPASVSSPSSPIFGRDLQCSSIVDMLISSANEPSTSSGRRIPVLAIYGIGGAGKTTLAQSIYNDSRVVEHFDKTMWVHVSRIFDAHAITKKIIESIQGECPHVENFDVLQSKLKDMLKSKKILLVLDDVWCRDKERWDQMLIPFNKVGEMGSRILITCRAEEVTSKLGVDHSFPLAEVEDDDCLSILMHYSFGDAKKEINDPQLLELAREIVKKLSKSPLAARMVGSSLRGKGVEYWEQTLQRGDMLKDTLGALYWSFEMLPPYLQRCFALCSLYPKGYRIEKLEDFIRLWIAQGFIEVPSNSTVTLEDEAMRYFNELLSNSFFQKNIDTDGEAYYGMHDLLHDLAEKVSKDYCFRIEDDRQRIPANVMHLSALSYKDISSHLPDIFKLVNLRTLIIVDSWPIEHNDISGFVQQVFMKFKKLRMLYLGGQYAKVIKLDKSIGGLKLLRYLRMGAAVEELPESLGKLYHLQFLVIDISIKNKVPQEFNKLINLRCMGRGDKITASKKQFGIGQLKNLQQLRGTLSIDGLENVKDKAEASEALLKEKKHVDRLELHWKRRSLERDGSMDAEVLEGLQPHRNLGALKLDGYNGVRLPIDLERLHSLEIVDCRNLQQISSLPSMLGRLVIRGCPNLSEVPLLPLGLRELTVHGCPKLVQLQPHVSSRLEELDLEDCGGGVETILSNMSLLCNDGENGSSSSIEGVGFVLRRLRITRCSILGENEKELCLDKLKTSLTHLELIGLPWLTSALLGPNLTAVEDVRIKNCENLRSIGNSLVSSSSLKSLRITNCPRLTVQQQQPDDHRGGGVMERLYVKGCPELTWLWNLNCFTSVRELRVTGCPKLTLIKSGGGGGGGGDDSLSPMPSSSSSSPLEMVTIDDLSLLTAALRRESLCLNSLWSLAIVCSTEHDKPLTAEQEELFQHHLTSLTELWFYNCGGLPSLAANLENISSLRKLDIGDCPKIESLPNLPASLETVYIRDCPKIESLPNLPASLVELYIWNCPKIESLPNLPASLRVLAIDGCPKIESLPNLPASLRVLAISDCPKIESLPNLPASLETVDIRGCPKIESLPNLPASLEHVDIWGGCHPRLKEKYGNDEKIRFQD
ncbi:putative disease resistance RPP13-like protein 1 [Iris pallida]|uniref:Disease resistance RPP13-like protein 1 n=1 Tax=Iris pallida TaxID=29817 RepID=A0AAX6DIK3_IRIPA|nr:putative disease resistance RPP13-like protein 1 [Iris pallida]